MTVAQEVTNTAWQSPQEQGRRFVVGNVSRCQFNGQGIHTTRPGSQ